MTANAIQMGANPLLDILYEDACLFVVNKPAGQLFQGHTSGLPQTLDAQVKAYIRDKKPGSENVYLGIVHRLDRPVSGLVVFGRNSKFTARLALQFSQRLVEKHYLAVVEGIVAAESGELVDDLPEDGVSTSGPDMGAAQRCHLAYRVLQRQESSTMLDITLGTGRRNQIRRQFQKAGHPIVGDGKFGAVSIFPGFENGSVLFRPIALHAARLTFLHPKTESPMTVVASVPQYWAPFSSQILNGLG